MGRMLESSTMGRTLFLRGLVVALAAFCAAYLIDTLVARYRVATHQDTALSTVTVYYSAALKNNKTLIFGGQPDMIVCIHALFPHFGYPTCRSVANKTIEID